MRIKRLCIRRREIPSDSASNNVRGTRRIIPSLSRQAVVTMSGVLAMSPIIMRRLNSLAHPEKHQPWRARGKHHRRFAQRLLHHAFMRVMSARRQARRRGARHSSRRVSISEISKANHLSAIIEKLVEAGMASILTECLHRSADK